ncbi:hypothetical protein BpHYR1_005994 [Brachionus plicatilis]|uniref:Uncharacterized protein n=1 Tax=Brachionus plicatilis TaxID=10195 RepID=A0A3M7SWE3_BRAPC|nr:hypothetical protein BpHYR1_005994 [Brachionus plicatilis]
MLDQSEQSDGMEAVGVGGEFVDVEPSGVGEAGLGREDALAAAHSAVHRQIAAHRHHAHGHDARRVRQLRRYRRQEQAAEALDHHVELDKGDAATLSAVSRAAHRNEAFDAAQRHQQLPVAAAAVEHGARAHVLLEVFGADVVGGEPLEYVLNGRVQKVRVVVKNVFAREQNVVDEQVARHYLLIALELEQVFDQVYDVELETLRHFVAACGHAGQQVHH